MGDFGGVFYSVGTGYSGTTNGEIHGTTGSLGDAIADAPLVDSSEGTEFVFVTTNGSYLAYTGDNGVWEFVSSFTTLRQPGGCVRRDGGRPDITFTPATSTTCITSREIRLTGIFMLWETPAPREAARYTKLT